MAEIIEIPSFGNQTLTFGFNGLQLDFDIQWNGRMNRYVVQITDATNQVVLENQSIEPYSTMDMYGIDLGGSSLLPVLTQINYLDSGETTYTFEDLGTILLLGFFTDDELLVIQPPVTTV